MSIVYGVDTSKQISPKDVRDAIVACFTIAHRKELDDLMQSSIDGDLTDSQIDKLKEINVKQIVRKFFEESEGNYDQPTKESILSVMDKLREFSTKFRNQAVIEKHYKEIMQLVNKLEY